MSGMIVLDPLLDVGPEAAAHLHQDIPESAATSGSVSSCLFTIGKPASSSARHARMVGFSPLFVPTDSDGKATAVLNAPQEHPSQPQLVPAMISSFELCTLTERQKPRRAGSSRTPLRYPTK